MQSWERVVLHDMFGSELLNIYKCQSRKGSEDKHITHQCKARQRKLLFVELNACKRILLYPLVGKCKCKLPPLAPPKAVVNRTFFAFFGKNRVGGKRK